MLLNVIAVKTQMDYQLELKFNNGELRRFDMRPLLAMKPWSRIASLHLFERARVEYGTVVWPEEIDIAPETLYDDSTPLYVNEDSPKYESKLQ
jgi:uncharacterized protein DUF2442